MSAARAVLVAGFPNTGTTITAMILGQHPSAFTTGELAQFPDKRHFTDRNICSCGEKVVDCAFWLGVRERYLQDPRSDARLYDLIAEASGRELVVDVAHDTDRVEALAADGSVDLRVVHMVRGRAGSAASPHHSSRPGAVAPSAVPAAPDPVALVGEWCLCRGWARFSSPLRHYLRTVG